MNYSKGTVINRIVSDLKGQKCDEIYAGILGFSEPFPIGMKNAEKGYVPDVIGVNGGSINLFSVENIRNGEVGSETIEKWRVFRLYAESHNGSLYIVGDALTVASVKEKITAIPSNVQFIELPN